MSTHVIAAPRSAVADYLELTKPRITLLVMLTALVGYVAGSRGPVSPVALVAALVGTGLVAAGASAFNMLFERHTDARMRRTRSRPLPAGRLKPVEVFVFGSLLTAVGLLELAWLSGRLAAALAFLTWTTYLFLYTPLKTRTSLSTIVGAFPGALPPVIGWAAARGTIDSGAYVLFAILFLWQIPHFLAIAWIYREDYALGGFPMLPVVDLDGRVTGRQAVAHTLALLLVSLAPTAAGMTGWLYFAAALVLGIVFIAVAVRAAVLRSLPAARTLFLASLVYLPCLSVVLLVDRQ
jgi:protoheme IX farnesyltransferase